MYELCLIVSSVAASVLIRRMSFEYVDIFLFNTLIADVVTQPWRGYRQFFLYGGESCQQIDGLVYHEVCVHSLHGNNYRVDIFFYFLLRVHIIFSCAAH